MKSALTRSFLIFSLVLAGLPSSRSFSANEKETKITELSPEQRTQHAEHLEKMAEAHKKLADCLKSSKSTSECHEEWHKEMKDACPMAKDGECHMMDGMGINHSHNHMHKKEKSKKVQ